jgi:hypothetical protein
MTLQASGPIKYTEIREEFGDPLSTDTTNSYSVGWTYWTPPAPWVKSSDGVAGWYNSGDPAAWSQFMIDHAVYPSNTDPLVGTHQAIWRIGGEGMSLLPADTYTLECQSDNSATFTWDETFLGETSDLTTPDGINYSSHNTYTTFTFNTTTETYHYLTANVTNDIYDTPEIGVTFDENGNLVTGAGSTNTLIRISIGWDDQRGGVHGFSFDHYKLPGLTDLQTGQPLEFSIRNEGNNPQSYGARTALVEVQPNTTYTADIKRGTYTENTYDDDGNLISSETKDVDTAYWRHNNNQRFCIPDQVGTDANAQVWISTPMNVFVPTPTDGHSSEDREIAEIVNRDRIQTRDFPAVGYYPEYDFGSRSDGVDPYSGSNFVPYDPATGLGGYLDNDGPQGLYPLEVDAEGKPTGNLDANGYPLRVQIRGMVQAEVMGKTMTADFVSAWNNNGIPTQAPGNPNDWNINPAGVAWELKNSSGTVIRRSSDSFNYTYPSPNWGTLLQTYSVYASNIGSLVDQWHEANYLFTTNSSSTYTIEASADSKFQILLVDNDTKNSVDVLSSENNESCNTGSCPTSNALVITPNSTHRLKVRVYNASSTSVPTNSWLYNPGGIAFTIKDSSGTILKTSRDTGNQGSLVSIGDGSSRFGNYRVSESFGSLVEVPLDTDAGVDLNLDIPKSGPIKFSNFYNARLNMAVDYYNGGTEYRPETGRSRYNDTTKVRVIGGFKAKPANPTGKKVILHINKLIGVDEDTKVGDYSGQSSKCAFRSGSNWGGSSTKIRIDVGSSGQVIGAGGNGGSTPDGSDSSSSPGNPGVSGTGALGIEHEGTVVNVRTGGSVKAGCGGGGGGGNHGTDQGFSGENATGGGGGGGAGLPPGAGGIAGEGHEGDGGDGNDGTISAGGSGGSGSDSGGDDSGPDETGVGGFGGEYSINHTNGLTAGQTGEQTGESGAGGAGGASGGAIRKTTGTTWTYGDEHVTDNVFGTGKGGAAESPIGVE